MKFIRKITNNILVSKISFRSIHMFIKNLIKKHIFITITIILYIIMFIAMSTYVYKTYNNIKTSNKQIINNNKKNEIGLLISQLNQNIDNLELKINKILFILDNNKNIH